MDHCETCGNEYANLIEVRLAGQTHKFDSFECAIHAMAPRCSQCGVPVVGHGVERGERIYCSASCARRSGAAGFVDHQ